MEPDGFPVERDVTNPSAYCRYCARPGLVCDALLKDDLTIFTPGDPCNLLTKNGGDQQPGTLGTGLANWKAYRAGASPNGLAGSPRSYDFSDSDAVRQRGTSPSPTWRGDVSSAAQLVFNSNNWNKVQYVKVTAFDDDVYEPNVNGRGQDAYVHHFVVAQDENLQHTYYDDIDVNDVVVSISDNDHAVAVQTLNTNNQLTPEEGHDVHAPQSSGCTTAGVDEYNACTSSNWAQRGSDKLVLSLSSEPMYDVVIYVQSGPFFDGTPSASTILPDDEQVILQDLGQFETCFAVAAGDGTASSTAGRLVTTCAYNGGAPAPSPIADVAGCDPHGSFIAAETFASAVPTTTADTAAAGGLASGGTVGTLAAANTAIVPGMVVSIDVTSVLTPQGKVQSVSGTTITFDRPITVADSTQMTFSYGSTADLPTQGFGTALGAYPNGLDLGDTCADLNVGSGDTPADTCNTYNSAGCSWDGSACAYSIPATGRKAMDLSCLVTTDETQCNAREGCIWYASIGSGTCLAETKGYDCNSYLVFTSTNWNVGQTLSVIAVDDDEDEVATLSPAPPSTTLATAPGVPSGSRGAYGTEPSEVGYLVASQDWYYNSDGARFIASTRTGYQPKFNSPAGFEEASATLTSAVLPSSYNAGRVVSTARGGDGAGSPFTGLPATPSVTLSMFDTRYGTHINRYPFTTGGSDTSNGQQKTVTASGSAAANGVDCGTSSPTYGCLVDDDSFTTDAANEVCTIETATSATETWTSQVTSFDPSQYTTVNLATCGATVKTQDNDDKGVMVSRSSCEATEGRRTYYQKDWDDTSANVGGHMKDPTVLETRYGLFMAANQWPGSLTPVYGTDPAAEPWLSNYCPPTPEGEAAATTPYDGAGATESACNADSLTNIDYWTASNVGTTLRSGVMTTEYNSGTDARFMTMPTCPLTVQLSSSPAEGKTVVVTLQEDPALAALRDNELYFYEEPTFRYLSTSLGTLSSTCDGDATHVDCFTDCDYTYPGSSWLSWADSGSCFINNVPIDTTDSAERFLPNGGTSIKLTFTSNDWSIGRRITIIALNDDVDEPPEVRTAYFTVDTDLTTDAIYNDAVISNADVTVAVFDDDIADLVLLCGANLDTTIGRSTTDVYAEDSTAALNFLGSYDDALGDELYVAAGMITGLADSFSNSIATTAVPYFGIDYNADGNADASSGSNTVPARVGYDAQDGLAHGWEHSFGGGGRPGQTIYDGSTLTAVSVGTAAGAAGTVDSTSPAGSLTTFQGSAGGSLVSPTSTTGATHASEFGPISAIEADASGSDSDPTAGCVAGVGFNTASEGVAQLQRCYPNTWAAWDSYDPYSDNYVLGTTPLSIMQAGATPTGWWNQVRGFKGVGPARTEDDNNYACTIHARECENVPEGFCYTENTLALNTGITDRSTCEQTSGVSWSYYRIGGTGSSQSGTYGENALGASTYACEGINAGSFEVRLNSDPGQKTVRRQYIGEATYTDEKELVYVVITPDATPQTQFEPTSLTFTSTGGYVNGKPTERWDKPAKFTVRPVDDDVDERRGYIVDFTAFTITTSHLGDAYHTYTTPYQTSAIGSSQMHVFGDSSAQRDEAHTNFRHTIRTVHTLDNDYAGITVSGPAPTSESTDNSVSSNTWTPGVAFELDITEGASFAWYTLQLDTQPAKIQRQAGTSPNNDYALGAAAISDPTTGCGDGYTGAAYTGDAFSSYVYFADNTYIARNARGTVCGSVEPPADYWVDVTVTQSIHVDLTVPPSCPTTAPWGGGSSPPSSEHPRFPFNADGSGLPYDEVNGRFSSMSTCVTTCRGWQRGAT
eukprot:SAG31_NODE_515_length_14710_cov_6.289097_12_plen_1809_part_00